MCISAYQVHATGIRAVFLELLREIRDQHSSTYVVVVPVAIYLKIFTCSITDLLLLLYSIKLQITVKMNGTK